MQQARSSRLNCGPVFISGRRGACTERVRWMYRASAVRGCMPTYCGRHVPLWGVETGRIVRASQSGTLHPVFERQSGMQRPEERQRDISSQINVPKRDAMSGRTQRGTASQIRAPKWDAASTIALGAYLVSISCSVSRARARVIAPAAHRSLIIGRPFDRAERPLAEGHG